MTNTIKMMAMTLCVIAFATLSSCSKEEDDEPTVIKWKCTYNKEFYGHFNENQYVGTEWEFSTEVADEDLHYYCLYINETLAGSYIHNTYAEPNFYEIKECAMEPTEFNEIVEYLNGEAIKIHDNTLVVEDYEGNPLISWSKM